MTKLSELLDVKLAKLSDYTAFRALTDFGKNHYIYGMLEFYHVSLSDIQFYDKYQELVKNLKNVKDIIEFGSARDKLIHYLEDFYEDAYVNDPQNDLYYNY